MADLRKDLVQHLRTKPSTAFSSAASPLSLVQYIADTVPKSVDLCPKITTKTVLAFAVGAVSHDDITTLSLKTGETIALGFKVGASDFGGWGATVADYKILIETPNIGSATESLKTTLKGYSFLDVFDEPGGSYFVLLDRNGDAPTWTLPVWITSSSTSVDLALPVLPEGYRRGDIYKKCAFLRIIDVWVEGSDDHHHNLTLLLKTDLAALGEQADNITNPDELASDGYSVDYPYFGDSEEITWEFEVTNPDSYTKAPSCSAHPVNSSALLISERKHQEGGTAKITRVYREIGEETEQTKSGYTLRYETADGVDLAARYPIVTLTLDVKLEDYSPPQCGASCPVTGSTACGDATELDFSSLTLIEPPILDPLNPVYGRMTAVYGRTPGYTKTDFQETRNFGTVKVYTQRLAIDGIPPVKGAQVGSGPDEFVVDVQTIEENACSKTVQWQVAELPSCERIGHLYNQETGELDEVKEITIPTSQVPATIKELNEGSLLMNVVAGGGGDSGADGEYLKSNGQWELGNYYFEWSDPNWTLNESGGSPAILETAGGGSDTGPHTASWSDYAVTSAASPLVGKLNDSGLYATDRPLDCHFSIVTTRKASPFTSRSYETYQNYTWPPVLSNVEMMDWVRQDGASDTYPMAVWSRYAYSGPCRALITETWSKDPMALDTVQRMIPLPISYSCPAFSISIPPSLHATGYFQCDFGSDHTVYDQNSGSRRDFVATTTFTDWPTSLIVSSVQRPYQGGYLKRTIRVYQPV